MVPVQSAILAFLNVVYDSISIYYTDFLSAPTPLLELGVDMDASGRS
jgi:hypothetical protein